MLQDLVYAIRGLRLHPGFTAMVAVTLALGIGVNAAMFSVLDRLLFRAPEHVVDPDRLVQIHVARLGRETVQSSQAYRTYRDLHEGVPAFESMAVATSRGDYPLGRGASATRVTGSQVTPSFFAMLGVRPQVGRFFTEDEAGEENPSRLAVIGHGFWQRHFAGAADAVGATLDMGADRYTVVGVAPKDFTGVELLDIDVWIPIAAADGLRFVKGPEWRTTRGSTWLYIYGRLGADATAEIAAAQATAAYRAGRRESLGADESGAAIDSASVVLGSVIPGRSPGSSGLAARSVVGQVSRLLGVVSLFVLLLACANVANLMLVRALGRRREIAVRLALGISRGRLAGQMLIEGLLLAGLGAAGALLLVQLSAGTIRRLLLADTWTGGAIDSRVLTITMIIALLTAVLTSLLPMIQAASPELVSALKSGNRSGGNASRSITRATLLGVQSALALVLLAGAGLFVRSLQRVAQLPIGVDLDRVVVADIAHATSGLSNQAARDLYLRFAERVRSVPGVTASAVSIAHSFGLGWGTRMSWRGERLTLPNQPQQGFSQYAITPDYFTVMGIRLLQGRNFADADRAGTAPVAIINETAARAFWPGGDAIGQCVVVGADSMPCTTIVGVVTNARRQQLVEGPIPQIYRPLLQLPAAVTDNTVSFFGYTLLARAERPEAVVEPVRRMIQATAPHVPYANVRTLMHQFGRHTRAWTLGASMFSLFGVLALVIAAIGLYSVVAFTMTQRRHEYGVRIALGATSGHVVWITMLRGLLPAAIGLIAGAALALAGGKLISTMLFHTPAHDPTVFGSAGAILLATAALASLVPGLRASRTDPARVLRDE